ncbi:hypothetical protein ACGFIV_17765 [Sphaerisporangium sp. NPDC049003]|uniref:hypothetical protein n=1 Tax=Sphaerisporangium sp. NPDC049003 TaxID=3364517 RepID=UPI00371AC70B
MVLIAADRDGGYHAIKGFAFQFDASLLQILNNPSAQIEIEGTQDIGVQCFHIQVKHRSTNYTLSKVAPAVRQMMHQFSTDRSARFSLYCYFADRLPGEIVTLTIAELDATLGRKANMYDDDTKMWFAKSFEIIFAPDFQSQFQLVVDRLKKILRAKSDSEAVFWHAVIHGYLRDLILNRPPGDRLVSLEDIKELVHHARKAVFEASYSQLCGHENYLRLLRDQYKSPTAHVPNRERLITIECDEKAHMVDVLDAITCLRRRYHVGESPAPFISLHGAIDLKKVKDVLWDAGEYFHDGFDYGGAAFSARSLVTPQLPGHGIKLVDFAMRAEVAAAAKVREVHDFYITEPTVNPYGEAKACHIYLDAVTDLQTIFRGRR